MFPMKMAMDLLNSDIPSCRIVGYIPLVSHCIPVNGAFDTIIPRCRPVCIKSSRLVIYHCVSHDVPIEFHPRHIDRVI